MGNMLPVAVWMVVVFISILIHELGHALVGRKLGGGVCWIRLWAFGGLAHQQGARFNQSSKAKMIAAGPVAGLALYALVSLIAIALWPTNRVGLDLVLTASTLWLYEPNNPELLQLIRETPMKTHVFIQFIWVNLFWSLVNLLPVFPLDGGQIAATYMKSSKKMHLLGIICGTSFAAIGYLLLNSYFIPMLFGLLAY
ncbi:MAG: site-2 protease family protein, partial [Rubritalea sp.]